MRTAPHILLVEDDPKLLSTVSDYLRMSGYTVTACSDGQNALDEFQSHGDKFSLLLLDGMLPDIDGYDVLKKIRKRSGQKPLLPRPTEQRTPDWDCLSSRRSPLWNTQNADLKTLTRVYVSGLTLSIV